MMRRIPIVYVVTVLGVAIAALVFLRGRPATVSLVAASPSPTPRPTVAATALGPTPSPSGTSQAGLTLTVKPGHGVVGSGVRITGSIAPDLLSSAPVYVELWPSGPHKSLGDKADTKYTGPVWPSQWRVRPGPDGHFMLDIVKVPRVIQTASGDLWLIKPGAHDFALVLDAQHKVFAPFQVDVPPPGPTTPPPPTVQFQHLWLADAQTGWLSI